MKPAVTKTALALAVLVLLAAPALAQHHGANIFKDPEFDLGAGKGPIELPFKVINNHLILPLTVRGETFDVVLDTGMPIPAVMLYETERVKGLEFDYGPMQVRVGGAGGGDPVAARLAQDESVGVGPAKMNGTTMLVMPPMKGMAHYHQGIVGTALFDNFVVDIDYDHGVVRLHDPDGYRASKDAVAVPLAFHGPRRVPYVTLTVETAGGTSGELEVVVDLGASHALSINTDELAGYVDPAGTISTTLGHGVGGAVNGRVGRLKSVGLGGFELTGVVATFPIDDHQHPGGMDSRNGNLGSGILKRFNVAFDYANERMLLEPNRSYPNAFEWDMSGMRMRPSAGGLEVYDVVAGSPAAQAGLSVEDVITHVNGKAASGDNLFELRDLMMQDGSELTIRATRGGQPVEVTLTLRRMV